jgi:hypothetical protein
VIEDTMRSLIAAWKKEKQSRAIAMGTVNRFFCAECAGDLITPSEKRDVPGSLASGILNGSRSV